MNQRGKLWTTSPNKLRRRPSVFNFTNLNVLDAVAIFNETTPQNLISALLPDVLIKGGDWKLEEIIGKKKLKASGGKVCTIDFVPKNRQPAVIEK